MPEELEPLTTKPRVVVENGPGGIDLALELEVAELPEEEAADFRDGPSALEEVVRRLRDALDLITFFTGGDTEARAWTLRRGQTALDAAAEIHSDIARGFIRCEVIRVEDLVECGSRAEAARRGLQRLEGKDYAVEDGDVLHIRFSSLSRCLEVRLHGRPVVVDDRVPGGVAEARAVVPDEHVLAEDAFELRGQRGQRAAGALVLRIGLELDAHAAEPLERVLEQQELRLDVRARRPGRVA